MIRERNQLTPVHRFHAWQSALIFSFLFFVHLLFSWSRFMSWVIFLGDLGLIAYLTMRAYVDGMFRLLSPLSSFYPYFRGIAVVTRECGRWIGSATVARWVIRATTMHFLMCIVFSMYEPNKLTTSLADTLDRYEVPFFGPLASRFVDDE